MINVPVISTDKNEIYASVVSVDAWLLRTVCCVHSGSNLSLVLPATQGDRWASWITGSVMVVRATGCYIN